MWIELAAGTLVNMDFVRDVQLVLGVSYPKIVLHFADGTKEEVICSDLDEAHEFMDFLTNKLNALTFVPSAASAS